MSVAIFRIFFDKPDKVYYSGKMVTGRVKLVNNSVITIKGVRIKIKGRAECKCYDSEDENDQQGFCKSSQICIRGERFLIGGIENFELPTGEHTYPFAIMLPATAPSSFSGRYGKISYYVTAKIDIPFALNKKEQYEFTVIRPVNVNRFLILRKPYQQEQKKTIWSLCCVSGTVTVLVRLPNIGFSASESIPITLEVDNGSKVELNGICVYLRRVICFTTKKYENHENLKLVELCSRNGVKAGRSRTWSESIKIPYIPFPNLDGCTIIKIDHELHVGDFLFFAGQLDFHFDNLIKFQVKIETSCMNKDINMHIPVTIADVPQWKLLHESKP